eukprot:gene6725-22255_t
MPDDAYIQDMAGEMKAPLIPPAKRGSAAEQHASFTHHGRGDLSVGGGG